MLVQVYWQHTVTGAAQWTNPATEHDMEVLKRRQARGQFTSLPHVCDEYFTPHADGEAGAAAYDTITAAAAPATMDYYAEDEYKDYNE